LTNVVADVTSKIKRTTFAKRFRMFLFCSTCNQGFSGKHFSHLARLQDYIRCWMLINLMRRGLMVRI